MFASQCLFCGQTAKKDKKRSIEVYPVRTVDFQNNILMICDERRDEWSAEVRGRIESVNDLHAADAVYHQSCSVNFRTKKLSHKQFYPNRSASQRKVDQTLQMNTFSLLFCFYSNMTMNKSQLLIL